MKKLIVAVVLTVCSAFPGCSNSEKPNVSILSNNHVTVNITLPPK